MSDTRTVIGRWESDGGRYWVELYTDQWGYGYDGRSCGGFLGKYDSITEEAVIEFMTARIAGNAGFFHPGKRPMRRTI